MDTNLVTTVASLAVGGAGLLYTVAARPKVRAFCTRVYEVNRMSTLEHGPVLYVVNTGRTAAVILAAGVRNSKGGLSNIAGPPPGLEGPGSTSTFPLVLAPGQIAHAWTMPSAASSTEFGAVQARYPWYGWRWLRHPRLASRTKRLREKRIRAVLPAP